VNQRRASKVSRLRSSVLGTPVLGLVLLGPWVLLASSTLGGCTTHSYYREASVGLVGCEEGDMEITDTGEFGTRTWTVKCPDKKRWRCEGLRGAASCQPVE
jgi:hypothetical protein